MQDRSALIMLGFRDGLRRPAGSGVIVAAATGAAVVTAVSLILYAWLG